MTDVTGQTGTVVVDKNKTPEQYMEEAEKKYIIPRLIRENFPDLIKLIYETESMDTEEREYWLQIMPIMSEEQISKFRNILVNEREQLEKLDHEYQGIKADVKPIDEAKLKEKMEQLKEKETQEESAESSEEEKLLEELEGMDGDAKP